MSAIVTCDKVGGSLTNWLKLATEAEKKALLNELLDILKNCSGEDLNVDDAIATCEDLDKAIKSLAEKLSKNLNHGAVLPEDVVNDDKPITAKGIINILLSQDDNDLKDAINGAVSLNQGDNLPADATDCTKPVTICGVTNILKSAKGNPVQTALVEAVLKKAQTDPVYRTELGGALLSKQAGNRIEVRSDGIGVWDEAPPNLVNQYVDALNGNDNNSGTRDAPLKTVAKAISNVKDGTGVGGYTILMRSGQTHMLASNVPSLPNADVAFVAYDDPKYGTASDSHGCPGYYPWLASDYIPAVLKVRNYTDNGFTYTPVVAANNILFRGVSIDHTDARATGPGAAQFIGLTTGLFHVQGGNVTVGTGRILARPGSLWGQYVNFYLQGTATLVSPVYGPTVTLDSANTDSGRQVTCANGPTLTIRNYNGRSAITPTNLGISNDSTTKRLLNGMTNWDIFANT